MKIKLHLLCFGIMIAISCKRETNCDDTAIEEYYDIPTSTKPFILNKKGEILVFANSKGDTVEFFCTDESHDYKIAFENSHYGTADCSRPFIKYAESYEYKYSGDTSFFGFMRVNYITNLNLPTYGTFTDFEINISDSILSKNTIENMLKRTQTDSILFSGKYYKGTYFVNPNILFNKELGIIKFIDSQKEQWRLIIKE